MTEDPVKVGFVCGKGHGHIQLSGELEYGVCSSKSVADIFVTVVESEDLYPEYRGLMRGADVAEYLKRLVHEHDTWREERVWNEN